MKGNKHLDRDRVAFVREEEKRWPLTLEMDQLDAELLAWAKIHKSKACDQALQAFGFPEGLSKKLLARMTRTGAESIDAKYYLDYGTADQLYLMRAQIQVSHVDIKRIGKHPKQQYWRALLQITIFQPIASSLN